MIQAKTLQDSLQGVAELAIDTATDELKDQISEHVLNTLAKYSGTTLDEETFNALAEDLTDFDGFAKDNVFILSLDCVQEAMVKVLHELKSINDDTE